MQPYGCNTPFLSSITSITSITSILLLLRLHALVVKWAYHIEQRVLFSLTAVNFAKIAVFDSKKAPTYGSC